MKTGNKRLFLTLLASFTLIIFLGASVNILTVALSTRRAYARMVRSSDETQAERIARLAEEYYRRNGTLAGIDILLELPSAYRMAPTRRMGDRMMMDPSQMARMVSPVIIIGEDGRVYADPQGQLAGLSAREYGDLQGKDIVHAGRKIGKVLAGSMIRPALEVRENEFLGLVVRSALISSISVALVAFLLGGFLFRSISAPVEALAAASRSIAGGDLKSRVNIRRKDELGELIEQFNAMAASIEASEEWKRRIISDSAHELRTPTAVIQGELEMILEGVYTADRARIEGLYRETELITRLLGEMGQLAAAEGGQLVLQWEEFDPVRLVQETITAFRPSADQKEVTLVAEPGPETIVSGDPQKIQQVIRNLISNALRAVDPGGRIDIQLVSLSEEIRISVDDSGPGVPEEYRERVFERFFRLDPSRSRESGGAGLGLAISRQIILLHGGRIWLDRGENGGARVSFSLPKKD